MTKNEFIAQFQALNTEIESAVAAQNFERVVSIDLARRKMLHEFAAKNAPDGDHQFFDALERCAADNARAITELTTEMNHMQKSTAGRLRGLSGYRG